MLPFKFHLQAEMTDAQAKLIAKALRFAASRHIFDLIEEDEEAELLASCAENSLEPSDVALHGWCY